MSHCALFTPMGITFRSLTIKLFIYSLFSHAYLRNLTIYNLIISDPDYVTFTLFLLTSNLEDKQTSATNRLSSS